MDGDLRNRTSDRRSLRQVDPPREHPGNEWRKLSAEPKPRPPRKRLKMIMTELACRPMRLGPYLLFGGRKLQGARAKLAYFCAAPVADFYAALNHIDRDRLVVAPDCGLGLLPTQLAEDKLRVMCKAAALI